MRWLWDVSYLFGGVFLVNALPHTISGLTGRAFQTPFAKPPGKGLSSSTVNVLWGFANLFVAYLLICRVGAFDFRSTEDALSLGVGLLLTGVMMARYFGRFHGGDRPTP